jgi:hypothetical protein
MELPPYVSPVWDRVLRRMTELDPDDGDPDDGDSQGDGNHDDDHGQGDHADGDHADGDHADGDHDDDDHDHDHDDRQGELAKAPSTGAPDPGPPGAPPASSAPWPVLLLALIGTLLASAIVWVETFGVEDPNQRAVEVVVVDVPMFPDGVDVQLKYDLYPPGVKGRSSLWIIIGQDAKDEAGTVVSGRTAHFANVFVTPTLASSIRSCRTSGELRVPPVQRTRVDASQEPRLVEALDAFNSYDLGPAPPSSRMVAESFQTFERLSFPVYERSNSTLVADISCEVDAGLWQQHGAPKSR